MTVTGWLAALATLELVDDDYVPGDTRERRDRSGSPASRGVSDG